VASRHLDYLIDNHISVKVDGVTVDLSAPVRPLTKEDLRRDWICMKCVAMNFSRRMECFQCNASREGNAQPVDESGPRGPAAGLNNDNVVIVRDLSEYVEEDTLRRTFQSYGGLKEVRMVRDKYTQLGKGFAFIEFDRHQEALHVVEESNHRGVYVENSRVKCALARGKDAPPKGGNQAVASAAIEAAMALNSSRMGGGKASSSGRRRDEEREDPQSVYGQPPAEGPDGSETALHLSGERLNGHNGCGVPTFATRLSSCHCA